MNIDAFSPGKIGGLTTKEDIRLLVCYMLASLPAPISSQHIGEILQENGLANFFEVMDSIGELIELGYMNEVDVHGEILMEINEKGKEIARELNRRIPLTIREKAVNSALSLLSRLKIERENRVEITGSEEGCYVTCHVSDGRSDIMTLSLKVADRLQAESIKEHFLSDPTKVYSGVLALQTGDYQYFSSLFDE